MATFDITVPASIGSVGNSDTLSVAFTAPPGDFDGATIDDVSVVGTPAFTSDGATDDTLGIRFRIETAAGGVVYGGYGSDADSLCFAVLGDSVSSDTIADGSAPNPGPGIGVLADWDEVGYQCNYSANMMGDDETATFPEFTIRVTYTPAIPPDNEQDGWRWYADDNSNANSTTALAGENTSYEVPLADLDTSHHLRFMVSNVAGAGGDANNLWSLWFDVDGGGYAQVTTTSDVEMSPGLPANGTATTPRITGGTGTFIAGEYVESSSISSDSDLPDGRKSDWVWCIEFPSEHFSGGETITFRVRYDGAELDTYNTTIQATIGLPPPPPNSALMRVPEYTIRRKR